LRQTANKLLTYGLFGWGKDSTIKFSQSNWLIEPLTIEELGAIKHDTAGDAWIGRVALQVVGGFYVVVGLLLQLCGSTGNCFSFSEIGN
jgi:hypothetical protein